VKDYDFDINIAVVGIGLIGGSYAMALRALKPRSIIGIDRDGKVLKNALHRGIVDEVYESGGKFLKDVDLVIAALYPGDTVKFVRDNLQNFKNGGIITDTSSVKRDVVRDINSFLPGHIEFVAGHPMTGRESRGIEFASADIFTNANYIITPSNKNTARGLKIIDEMARRIGCGSVVYVSPEKHDDIIAFTSQLPHAAAVSIINSHGENFINSMSSFIGGSFKDITRVAQINSELWSELFMMNSDKLIDEIEIFQRSMDRLKTALKGKDTDMLKDIFENAACRRKSLIKR
jgi:prephenate dehydrogenase